MEKENQKVEKTPDISDESFTTRMLYKMIRAKFPKVYQLSTETLQEWINDDSVSPQVLLLDVRETEERNISSIKNSIHVLPSETNLSPLLEKLESLNYKKVVAYCSVGYRSSMLAQKLYSELKHSNKKFDDIEIFNLEGSIFKWTNEDKEIIDSKGKSTTFVHPYNAIWGKFLAVEKRKYPDTSNL